MRKSLEIKEGILRFMGRIAAEEDFAVVNRFGYGYLMGMNAAEDKGHLDQAGADEPILAAADRLPYRAGPIA